MQLFRIFNDGTHGLAGTFDFLQLNAIKKRVEDGIMFLAVALSLLRVIWLAYETMRRNAVGGGSAVP